MIKGKNAEAAEGVGLCDALINELFICTIRILISSTALTPRSRPRPDSNVTLVRRCRDAVCMPTTYVVSLCR